MPPSRRRKHPTPPQTPAHQAEMRTPVWPERACRDMVNGETALYSCDVVESHHGPHASLSVPQSVEQRLAWEAKNPGKREPAGTDPFVTS
ncbi:hypothetical protein OG497_38020 [Streptomyces sp. NBC_01242]|uniref:hypothetical protein n=1 Tax=Streptomyces sp. NBC_01242 TaxID=2903795 RepID=UPI0022514E03|nr:hypothetical protein [Streptomyces sp. NBC_01242]MCX4799657.1 hypothetical protein [Streptomyces sp. NBC_01242]